MRPFFLSLAVLPFLFGVSYADEPVAEKDTAITLQDYDQQISILKEQIARYESLALAFDRKAGRLQTRDFSGYRRALRLREQFRGIANDLKKRLDEMVEQRDTFAKESA